MSLWSWIKNLFVSKKKTKPAEPRFEATPIDLIMGVDYAISSWNDVRGREWAKIVLLKGLYKGVSFKFNRLSLIDQTDDQAAMEMDYDLIDYVGFTKDVLERNDQFQNIVFNVAFSLLMALDLTTTEPDKNEEDEDSGSSEIPGRNNSGKPDSE